MNRELREVQQREMQRWYNSVHWYMGGANQLESISAEKNLGALVDKNAEHEAAMCPHGKELQQQTRLH